MASVSATATGPVWGLLLAPAGASIVARSVTPNGLAWNLDIRPGYVIRSLDGDSPWAYPGRGLRHVRRIVFADAQGVRREVRAPTFSTPLMAALFVTALFFVSLGAVVFRWAADSRVGFTFFVFGWAVAATLEAIPAAAVGYRWGFLVAAPSAVVASSAFLVLFLTFPRPLRWAGLLTGVTTLITVILVTAIGGFIALARPFPPWLDSILWLWVAITLISGLATAGIRTRNAADRARLAPIIISGSVSVAPLVLLDALPVAIRRTGLVPIEFAPLALVGIPFGFTYAILRHRLFALDALLRRFLLRFADAATFVAVFILVSSALGRAGMAAPLSGALAAIVVALAAPRLSRVLGDLLDRSLYQAVFEARRPVTGDAQGSVRDLATSLCRQVRQLVPVQWVALIQRGRLLDPAAEDTWPALLVAVDGDAPIHLLRGRWVEDRLLFSASAKDRFLVPIDSGARRLGALVIGPRLNDTPLNSLEIETIRLLATQAATSLEAAALRQQADDERSFREGLSELARELSAAGSVVEVLRITASRALALLGADVSLIWLRDTTGQPDLVAAGGTDADRFAAAIRTLPWSTRHGTDDSLLPIAVSVVRERSSEPAGTESYSRIVYRLGAGSSREAFGLVARLDPDQPFSQDDERRAVAVVEHADGAYRRAQAIAQAAEAETMRQITTARSEFLDVVSHDLQNPLTVIQGFAELLEQRLTVGGDPVLITQVRSILEAAATAKRLIEDLLTTSRAEAGRLTLHRESIDANAFLERFATQQRILPGGDRIRLEASEPVTLYADVARLEQMVGNLLTNALRYSETGPVTLRTRNLTPREACIEVCDQGKGIAPEEQALIWNRFYRTRSGELRSTRGAGVGLSVVRALAELHGGRAEVESSPGQGSVFRVVLPVAPEPVAVDEASSSGEAKGNGSTAAA